MTTATVTLSEFLLARIAEDEKVAERNKPSGVSVGPRERYRRALAECEAKRRIVEWDANEYVGYPPVKYLAAIYSDHPDYRDEWRP